MGTYVKPGNAGFAEILRSEYVDKTGIVGLFDETLEQKGKLVLVSRPRRFGKSYAASTLVAFYSVGCDSRALFEGLDVSEHDGWDAHLNARNVVSLDMTEVINAFGVDDVAAGVARLLLPELRTIVPDTGERLAGTGAELSAAFVDVVHATGRKFVFVIDEWDAPYRLAQSNKAA